MSDPRWRIPAAVLLALALQAASALLWAGRASARIDELSQRMDLQRPVAERLARLETQGAAVRASLDRIERRLDQQEER